MKRNGCVILGVVCALSVQSANGDMTYGFGAISANNVNDVLIAESQLFVDVMDSGSSQVLFTFRNEGPLASSITDVYFDDDNGLLNFAGLFDEDDNSGDPGVDYSLGASPSNLPSGNNASPSFVANIGLDADPPPGGPNGNGVNPGESLGILFDIQGGLAFDDVIDDLTAAALRLGIHVQSFASGGSESLINDTDPIPANNPIPAPGAAILAVMGLSAVGFWRRRAA